ncbi:hypothetical protein [Tateyamaria sp.]|uniref:hypothetical protein n=1 Tax=Tateyamaria sp. TaxID=1929288 RepID=UPI0032A04C48
MPGPGVTAFDTFSGFDVPTSLDAGFYELTFVPLANEGSFSYTVQFGDATPIPLPAGVALYTPVMFGAGVVAMRRRRAKRV